MLTLCPQEYERASKVDQFVTRFLLRETVSQLQALQSSLEGASDTLEAQAQGPRYVRCPAGHGLHIPGPSASISFRSSGIPEPTFLFLAREAERGWLALRLALCPRKPVVPHLCLALFWGPSPWPVGLGAVG